MPEATEHLNRLWAEYKATRSVQLRNRLIEEYRPLVRNIAERVHTKLPEEVELDDLISFGTFGLMDAVRLFDPSRGWRFGTFATRRIFGAIMDGLRQSDWQSRVSRTNIKKLAELASEFASTQGRPPTDEELADRSDLTPLQFYRFQLDRVAMMGSLYAVAGRDPEGKEIRVVDAIVDESNPAPESRLDSADALDGIIRLVLNKFSLTDALMLRLIYIDGLTLQVVGAMLGGVSESAMSVRRRTLFDRIRARYDIDSIRGMTRGAA